MASYLILMKQEAPQREYPLRAGRHNTLATSNVQRSIIIRTPTGLAFSCPARRLVAHGKSRMHEFRRITKNGTMIESSFAEML